MRIARRFPSEELWAGKTGSMRGVRNDSGILRTKKGRFVLAILTDGSESESASSADHPSVLAIADVAQAIVGAWMEGAAGPGREAAIESRLARAGRKDMKRFDGRRALVTGASRGIGEAVARRLAAEGSVRPRGGPDGGGSRARRRGDRGGGRRRGRRRARPRGLRVDRDRPRRRRSPAERSTSSSTTPGSPTTTFSCACPASRGTA